MISARRSARNPQRFTVTSGGRRIRLAGGNAFASRRDAASAARHLRIEHGGIYRVRALKAGEATRAAVANGRERSVPVGGKCEACRERRAARVLPGAGAPHVCEGCYRVMLREDEHARRSSCNGRPKSTSRGKKRGATGVRRSMKNGTPLLGSLTIDAVEELSRKKHYAADRKAYERAIEKLIAHRDGGDDGNWYNPLGGESDDYTLHGWWNWHELPTTAGVRVGIRTLDNGKRELYAAKKAYRGAHYTTVLYLLGE